jgi:hypothetical protein
MNKKWWEAPTCLICDKWWLFLIIIIIVATAFFTRDLWLPLIGIEPEIPELQTGDIQVTLTWKTEDDLDLWVADPQGETINYNTKSSSSSGRLDLDANAACQGNLTNEPIENIYWADGGAPNGKFSVEVHYYEKCVSSKPITFHVRLLVDGEVKEYDGRISNEKDIILITKFER